MAATDRQTNHTLTAEWRELLRDQDHFFEFVRVLETLARQSRDEKRGVGVGLDGPPEREAVRFSGTQHMNFPPGAVAEVKPSADANSTRTDINVNFMGLTGPSGALPSHYGRMVQNRLRQKDNALADFFNLFNHRLISLYYRAWAKYRPVIGMEESAPQQDAFTQVVAALAGNQACGGFESRLYYGGHFAREIRTAATLENLLRDHLDQPVRVNSMVGQWLYLEADDRVKLGSGKRGANNHLGSGLLLGRRCWDIQGRLRIHIGPMSHARHEQLQPGNPAFRELKRLILAYVPTHIDVELSFHIADRGQARARLARGMKLGRNSWLQAGQQQQRVARIRLHRDGASTAAH